MIAMWWRREQVRANFKIGGVVPKTVVPITIYGLTSSAVLSPVFEEVWKIC